MMNLKGWSLAIGALALGVAAVASQPSEDRRRPNGPTRSWFDGPPPPPPSHHMPPPPPPRPYELGKVMPPHIRGELNVSEEQDLQLDDIEREVKQRILKLLNTEQKKKLAGFRFGRPGGRPRAAEARGSSECEERPQNSQRPNAPPPPADENPEEFESRGSSW